MNIYIVGKGGIFLYFASYCLSGSRCRGTWLWCAMCQRGYDL